jgi:carboxypeptidase family protein
MKLMANQIPLTARVLLLLALIPPSLYGQAANALPPEEPTAGSGTQQAQGISGPQNQPQGPNQSQRPSPSPQEQDSAQGTPIPQPGNILGTVTDLNNDPVPGASVVLENAALSDRHEVTTNDLGFFEIRNLKPGIPYHVTITASGFANWTSDVFLDPGQHKILTGMQLQIEEMQTAVTVKAESALEVATEQVNVAEKQRGWGIIPNFFEVFDPHPEPLTAKLKFRLSFRVVRDPFTIAGVGMLAGFGQASRSPSYDEGMKGYAERFAANYADTFTDLMIGGAVLPSLLHQDPRYYYQGTGTKKSRALHAISNLFITKGDNGRTQPNYSSIGGDLASAALSNLYYPKADRGAGLVLRGFAVSTAVHLGARLFQEFVFRPSK